MEYIKAFAIGTSGLTIFPELINISNPDHYKNPEIYPFIIPLFYGVMTVITYILWKGFKISLKYALFIVSVLSSIIVVITNYRLNKYEKKDNEKNNIQFFIFNDIIRVLIIFNIIIYYLIINFSKSEAIRYFIIGSCIYSYYINYYSIYHGGSLAAGQYDDNVVKFDFKYYAITEPIWQGSMLMIGLYIGIKYLKLSLLSSLIIYHIISRILMVMIAYKTKIYNLQGNEWISIYFIGLLKIAVIKVIIQYYLIRYLK